ncbi:MAG TPA: SCP2 sterol-binding domain-containing protein [Steroidobacteraceae bacterium]|nr:SCP2 sterol-binding domain-containing protein [Steroidobacteraceae bacterium]
MNRNIASSSSARAACNRLAGKTLAVHLHSSPQNMLASFFLRCENERLSISAKSDAAVAASLSGTPLAYLSMLRTQPENAMRSGSVRIEGDAEAAQAFRDLLKAAQPDIEEELSRVIGDVAAHQLANIARGAIKFGERVANTFAQNVAEYLQEESRDVVTRIEVDEFVTAVDRVREAVDRADAKVSLLERNTKK